MIVFEDAKCYGEKKATMGVRGQEVPELGWFAVFDKAVGEGLRWCHWHRPTKEVRGEAGDPSGEERRRDRRSRCFGAILSQDSEEENGGR